MDFEELKNLKEPQLLYQDSDLLIVWKPPQWHTLPLNSDDDKITLQSWLIEEFKILKEIKGHRDFEHGILYRLDYETSGIILVALQDQVFDYLAQLQKENAIIKNYHANTQSVHNFYSNNITSYFRPYGENSKKVKVVIPPIKKQDTKKISKEKYTTYIKKITTYNKISCWNIKITKGYRHQIRAHLAYLGFPIKGDSLYGKEALNSSLELYATAIHFSYPSNYVTNMEKTNTFSFSVFS